MIWDPVHDSREAFLTCLRAQCAPGFPQGPLPAAGISADPHLDGASAILLALLDPGLGLCVVGDEPDLMSVGERLRHGTGAAEAQLADADFVLVGAGAPLGIAARARRGSALAPERGATIVYCAPTPACGVELSGPGIDGTVRVPVPLSAADLAAVAAANADLPRGVDVFVLTAPDQVLAIPRSVTLGTDR